MAKINPAFGKELNKYGAVNFNACYNCGNCTAVCSLSTEDDSFPREMVRLSALGLEDDIKASLKPWECYYCGECSTHCPQEANPGELMMSLRRYLTAKYLREKLGGIPEQAKENLKAFNGIKKQILEALKDEDLTIKQLTEKLNMPSDEVVYYLTSLVKYGFVKTGEVDDMDEYYTYKLNK